MIKCPTCATPMLLRNGRYGEFYYCTHHGTISKRAVDHTLNHTPAPSGDVLMDAVKRKGVLMGHHLDEMGQLVDWFNDSEDRAEWDEDHWMNIRPY